ncbi:MAG TPA: endonuclease/exonuclease/phosphatase family protein [Ignavibacteriaceae bacterium]|nr:endonuclease/exonuclease/phosphatase family protein [Ignavibacteriaceae bacterium]
MKNLVITFLFLFPTMIYSQSLPIFLDGRTDDWNVPVPTYIDSENDGNAYDFKYVSVTNDEKFLFIKIKITPFLKLLEDNQISVFIDGDNNSSTGYQINGIGAELRFNFGARNGFNYYTNNSITHSGIQFRSLPTVTDTTYEIAIGRQFIPPAGGNGTIKIFFIDNSANGDWMPNSGETFEYTFDITPTEPLILIELSREDTSLLRVMNWNALNDGLLDPNREQNFARVLQAINPDIIAFNEMWNSNTSQIQSKLNTFLPLQTGSWNAVKLDGGNITASKYPILQNWLVYPGQRITASLIDLPERFGKDILVINCHFKCCGGATNDATRQREADATIAFILDAKTPGGVINLPEQTPFVILGDLNLVGNRQQLITLITGEIINTQLFGSGGPPDWDNSDLEDLLSMQTDKRTAYTWREDQNSFPPGRLDFQIYSNSVINVEKDFVLQTEVMSQARLNQYGLQLLDTRTASDHFPIVADISFDPITGVQYENNLFNYRLDQNYPNPFNPSTTINFSIAEASLVKIAVYNLLGQEVALVVNEVKEVGSHSITFDATGLPSGAYFYTIETPQFKQTRKMLLAK